MTSFLLVIEGLDRTGKSTLAKTVAGMTGSTVTHFDRPRAHPLDEYLSPIARWSAHDRKIFDRYHVGETVWPTIFKRDTPYDKTMHTYVEMVLLSRGALLVRTTRNMDDLKAALLEDNEPLTPDLADTADRMFTDGVTNSFLPTATWSIGKTKQILAIVDRATKLGKASSYVMSITSKVIGNITDPDVLLVVGSSDAALPLIPHAGTPGSLIIGELAQHPRLARRAAIASLHTADGLTQPLNELTDSLFGPQLVALGQAVSHELKRQGLPHSVVDHPTDVQSAKSIIERMQ